VIVVEGFFRLPQSVSSGLPLRSGTDGSSLIRSPTTATDERFRQIILMLDGDERGDGLAPPSQSDWHATVLCG